MSREALRLSRPLLGLYRPGVQVAVELGLSLGLHQRGQRPSGYQLRASLSGSAIAASAPSAPSGPGTAVLEIRGAMTEYERGWDCGDSMGYDRIAADYCRAHRDPAVASLVVDANTPGGDVPGIAAGVEVMRAAKALSGKPTIGFVGSLCASGGVWLLSGVCDAIVVRADARMGSVGCVVAHESEARALRDAGIDVELFRDPQGKMNPNGVEELDDLGRARLNDLALAGAARFVLALVAFRDLDPAVVRSWNGGMFTGEAALEVELADLVGSLDDAIAWAGSMARQEAA